MVTLLAAAGMAYCWFLLYDAGHGYWLATAVLTALPVVLAAYLAVVFGHCRNRAVAGALGVMATLVFQLGYFHADLVRQMGPEALLSFDQLPEFIGNRMANDGIGSDWDSCRGANCTTGSTPRSSSSPFPCS